MTAKSEMWLEIHEEENDDEYDPEEFEDDHPSGYLYLPAHPGSGVVGASKKNVRLSDLLDFKGPDVVFDLDENNNLIGIEIV